MICLMLPWIGTVRTCCVRVSTPPDTTKPMPPSARGYAHPVVYLLVLLIESAGFLSLREALLQLGLLPIFVFQSCQTRPADLIVHHGKHLIALLCKSPPGSFVCGFLLLIAQFHRGDVGRRAGEERGAWRWPRQPGRRVANHLGDCHSACGVVYDMIYLENC